ncbi:MAG: hypothetical protein R3E84_14130 [Pseudomonadales bacterium]
MRPHSAYQRFGLGVLVSLAIGTAQADESFLTGNWGGTRDTWADHGLDVEIAFTADVVHVADGGCGAAPRSRPISISSSRWTPAPRVGGRTVTF